MARETPIVTPEEMLRGFRFPPPRPRDAAFLLAGALLLALLLKLLSLRKGKPLPPPIGGPSENQRRADYRVPAQFPAEYLPEGAADWLQGTVCDLSAGGVTLMTDHAQPPRGLLSLRFRHGNEPFEGLSAEVVRADAAHWSHRNYLHCRFLALAPDLERRLRHTIAEREREILRHTGPD